MPFHPIAHTAKVELLLHHTLTLQPVVNVLHAEVVTAPATLAAVTQWAHDVDTFVGAHLNVWANQMFYDGCRVTGLDTATDPQALSVVGAGSGTGGNGTSPGLSCLAKLTTAIRGRETRGRVFIGACPQSDLINDGTQWDPAYTAVVHTLIAGIQTALGASTPASDLVVASRKAGTSQPVTNIQIEPAPAFQRRRAQR